MFERKFVDENAQPGCLCLVEAPILVDQDDFEGIRIAAATLSEDFSRVTQRPSHVVSDITRDIASAVIIGSVTNSALIRSLIRLGKLEVSRIEGQWECFTTQLVDNPIERCAKALVIAGSDKRGTIFGIYTLSHQIGVSP